MKQVWPIIVYFILPLIANIAPHFNSGWATITIIILAIGSQAIEVVSHKIEGLAAGIVMADVAITIITQIVMYVFV